MRYFMIIVLLVYVKCELSNNYSKERVKIIQLESKLSLGGNTSLSEKEFLVNNCLMKFKYEEIDYAFNHPEYFNFSHHFFTYKDRIKESKVYKIIKDMPKGAVLHIHDTAIMGPDYLLNITYMENLYVCFGGRMLTQFSKTVPEIPCDGVWQLMKDARAAAGNTTNFDQTIRKEFTLVVDNPDVAYPTIKETCTAFRKYFNVAIPLISYMPIRMQYIYDALKMFRDENVMYVEVRTSLQTLYDLDGRTYDKIAVATLYRDIINKFKRQYPDFIGAKIIYAPYRKVDELAMKDNIEMARKIKNTVPDIFAGYDLIGQEDLGDPLIKYASQLEAVHDLDFFFHAGETNWYGTATDMNLIDAVLLGTKRIGHAYALVKHPVVMAAVKERNIGLEVNVLSTSILSQVKDLRNHPLSVLLANGMPVVISSDDPGAWEADGLSDDFYAAFVGVASRLSDLRLLKTLALNSLKYSALDGVQKDKAIRNFNIKWDVFVNDFDCNIY